MPDNTRTPCNWGTAAGLKGTSKNSSHAEATPSVLKGLVAVRNSSRGIFRGVLKHSCPFTRVEPQRTGSAQATLAFRFCAGFICVGLRKRNDGPSVAESRSRKRSRSRLAEPDRAGPTRSEVVGAVADRCPMFTPQWRGVASVTAPDEERIARRARSVAGCKAKRGRAVCPRARRANSYPNRAYASPLGWPAQPNARSRSRSIIQRRGLWTNSSPNCIGRVIWTVPAWPWPWASRSD